MKIPRKQLLLAAVLAMSSAWSAAAFDLKQSSPTVKEDFNKVYDSNVAEKSDTESAIALPDGWKIDRNMDAPRRVGAWSDASTTVMYQGGSSLSSTAKNGTWSFGATPDERAIGGLSTGSVGGSSAGTRGLSLMTKLTNTDDSKIITNLSLKYAIEKYRLGNNSAGFSVRIFTSPDGEKWTEATDLITSFSPDATTDGIAEVPAEVTNKDQSLRVHVESGDDLYIAWNISVTSGTTCSGAQGLAIDDVELTATFADDDPDWKEDETPDFVPSGIYMRGVDGVWDAQDEWEFSKLSDTEFAIYNKTISGTFKIADASWSKDCNYGSDGSNITMGVPYTLVSGDDPANISCGNLSFNCSRIYLTIKDGEAVLLLEPNTSTAGLTSVYMVGDFNGWNYMGTEGKLDLDADDNLFKGNIGLTAGADGLSRWMIYQRLALAGAWGLADDATEATTKGTLVAGETGTVATEPGMYQVTFNIATGEYSMELMGSTATTIKVSPANAIVVPEVPETVKVLSLNNSLIHYNDQAKVFNDIAASAGKNATWTKHTNLGKTLDYHWSEGDGMTEAGEPGAKMMVRQDAWSHIILQEQTALPRTDFDSFRTSVEKWVDYIRNYCPNPNAVIIVPLNWALGQDWGNFTDYNKTLVENYTKIAREFGVVICPVGLAYQAKFDNDGGAKTEADWFLPGDDRHPTLKATYLAALMEYGIIFGEDPTTISYYPDYTTEYDLVGEMSDAIAAEMRTYASDALKAYKNVVENHSATVNLKASVLDQFGLEMVNDELTWSVEPAGATVTDGVFKATENGTYTVTVTGAGLEAQATITVTDAITEAPAMPYFSFTNDNLTYTQDFDSMGQDEEARIPEGWRADGQLTERTLGSFQSASEQTLKAGGAGFGSSAKNGVWNLGSSSDENDRALGGITTDTAGGAKSINIYAHIKNEASRAISSLDLSYDIEKYRDGSNAAGFSVVLYTSVDGRNWTKAGDDFVTDFEPSAATVGSDIVPMETRSVNGTIEKELVPGAELFLAWNISATSGSSCMSAPVLAIDNVEIAAELKEIPVFDFYIYIENQAGYEKTGLYAWGDSELFGAWPGQAPIDTKVINGITFEVFGHNAATGNFNFIYNNNNNGSQHNDYAGVGGQDYYFLADGQNLSLHETTVIESIDTATDGGIEINGNVISCAGATRIDIYNMAGARLLQGSGSTLDIASLGHGIYLAIASTESGNVSLTFAKR